MKVALMSASDLEGGAARAMYRLHRGLPQVGVASSLVVRNKRSPDPTVYDTDAVYAEHYIRRLGLTAIQNVFIDQDRSDRSNTLFSLPYPGIDVSQFPPVANADVIHLHWLGKFQSVTTVQKLLHLGKPVVWTLHDCSAFTGGCHYPAGCEGYQTTCQSCPQLVENPIDLPAHLLQDKLALFDTPITVVTPSQWLADCARKSVLFRQQRIEVIPYGLETDVFRPWPKGEAKRALGLEKGAIALLIGANDGNEQRKGFLPLFQALERCRTYPQFQQKLEAGQVTLLCFGTPSDDLESLQIPVHSFGMVDSDDTLSQIYSAADLFILPSLEDNLPNTMLESMACGTPVIAFATGGIPDAVGDGQTGKLVPPGDLDALAQAIVTLVDAPEQCEILGKNARNHVEAHYRLTQQAERYAALYRELQPTPSLAPDSSDSSADPPSLEETVHLDMSMGPQFGRLYPALSEEALVREWRSQEKQFMTARDRWAEQREELVTRFQAQLEETRLTLHHTRVELHQMFEQLTDRQAELARSQDKIAELEQRIAEMERSRFWKMRNAWVKLKHLGRKPEA